VLRVDVGDGGTELSKHVGRGLEVRRDTRHVDRGRGASSDSDEAHGINSAVGAMRRCAAISTPRYGAHSAERVGSTIDPGRAAQLPQDAVSRCGDHVVVVGPEQTIKRGTSLLGST